MTDEATCTDQFSRKAAYNWDCGKSDAIVQWGTHPEPPTEDSSAQTPADAVAIKTVGTSTAVCQTCKCLHWGSRQHAYAANCNGGTSQKWFMTAAGEVKSMKDGGVRCLDSCMSSRDCGKPKMWNCDGRWSQKWTISEGQLKNIRDFKCLGYYPHAKNPKTITEKCDVKNGGHQWYFDLSAGLLQQSREAEKGNVWRVEIDSAGQWDVEKSSNADGSTKTIQKHDQTKLAAHMRNL